MLFVDDQSQILSMNAASLAEQTVCKISRSCLTERTSYVSQYVQNCLIFEFVMGFSERYFSRIFNLLI